MMCVQCEIIWLLFSFGQIVWCLSWHISCFFCTEHFKQQPASLRTAAWQQAASGQGTSKGGG
jgi:hypothetical protein